MTVTNDQALELLDRLVATWTTEATHPALPDVVVHGTAVIEWLEGKRFLVHRARTDHPQFPDSISIIGFTDRDRLDAASSSPAATTLSMHYFDSRGVFRAYDVRIDETSWQVSRDAPGFAQRFTGTFADGDDTIIGRWQVCEDDVSWNDDLEITYRRKPATGSELA